MRNLLSALPLLLLLACHGSPTAVAGTQVHMDFSRAAGLYAAPFPSDELRRDDRSIDLSLFPNPGRVTLVDQALQLLARDGRGFALAGGTFFKLSAPLDPARLPDRVSSAAPGASVFLFSVDADDGPALTPIEVAFEADGGPLGAANLLSLVPVQGFPLRPLHTYAAVVLRALGDASGKPLGVSLTMARLAAGERPPELAPAAFAQYRRALTALRAAHVDASSIAGLAVFTTGDPTAQLDTVLADAVKRAPPLPARSPALLEVHDDFCVYSTTVFQPDYQRGTPPFTKEGGGWLFGPDGAPVFQRSEEANLFVSVPRRPMPAAGWPTVLYVRAGGGGDKPFVDRGPVLVEGGPTTPGTGPALHFAQVGFAAVQVDGPLGGRRNTTGGDEQFLVFNVFNPEALRDNVRQSALELSLMARALPRLSFPTTDCPGSGASWSLDPAHLAIFGHSTGATMAPIALAIEPSLGAAMLSGAGGSWIENVMYKQLPVDVRPVAELLVYNGQRALTGHDPVLTLVQWAVEPADPQAYARRVLRVPPAGAPTRHVLMMQGIVDHYILPRIANTTSLGIGLDLAGPALDSSPPEAPEEVQLASLLPLAGGAQIALPASGNRAAGAATTVVTQHPGDALQDGHEVFFQTEPPRHQARCFLASWLTGLPRVPTRAPIAAPCD
jgi:hypothetical protein